MCRRFRDRPFVLAAVLLTAAGCTLLAPRPAAAVPMCNGGEVVWSNGRPAGCLFRGQFGDVEKSMCGGTVVLAPSGTGSCWVCVKQELVPVVKDPAQWKNLTVGVDAAGSKPADFGCLQGLAYQEGPRGELDATVVGQPIQGPVAIDGPARPERCEVCECREGTFDPDRRACVVERCDVPGMSDGDKGGPWFARGGKLYQIAGRPACRPGTWTGWLQRDRPSGQGDYETLQDFAAAGQSCPAPAAIECRTVDGRPWQQTGEVYTCRADLGGVCRNADQPRGRQCSDYRVRFCCP